jgi:putative transposase
MPQSRTDQDQSSSITDPGQVDFHQALRETTRQAVRQVLEATMREELTMFLQAQPYQRADERRGQRNGYYQRDLVTQAGRLADLRVPRDRAGQFQSQVFERFDRYEPQVRAAILEMFVAGVSTRKVERITQPLLDAAPSASTVSRIAQGLETDWQTWRNRPLEAHYLVLYIDGVYFPVLHGEQVDETPLLVALGVDPTGSKEVLAMIVAGSESQDSWQSLLDDLTQRGVRRVDLAVTDGDTGLIAALSRTFPAAKRQRCVTHKMRNVFAKVGPRGKQELAAALKAIFAQPSLACSREHLDAFRLRYEASYPEAVACLMRDIDSCLTFYTCPPVWWRYVRTTNVLEGLFHSIRLRTDSMGAFRSETSCLRLVYAACAGIQLQRFPIRPAADLHST